MRYFVAPAQPKDVDELAALVNAAYRGESSRAGWTTEADFLGGQRTSAAQMAGGSLAFRERRRA